MQPTDSGALQRFQFIINNVSGSLRSVLLQFEQLTGSEKAKHRNQVFVRRISLALRAFTAVAVEPELSDESIHEGSCQRSMKKAREATIARRDVLLETVQSVEACPESVTLRYLTRRVVQGRCHPHKSAISRCLQPRSN